MAGAIAEPPAHLIASGLLREEADEIARVYAEHLNLRERERRTRGDWAALSLTRR
jgi:ribosomal protein L11 methylase PrmA